MRELARLLPVEWTDQYIWDAVKRAVRRLRRRLSAGQKEGPR